MRRRHKLPKGVQGYVTEWGKQVYYLRGRPKIRVQVAEDVLPWSPTFMAAVESAKAQRPSNTKQIINRPPVAGTVNSALIGYYDCEAFKALSKTTRQNRRAILERLLRAEHGDKRTIMMHAKACKRSRRSSSPTCSAISDERCSTLFATTACRSD
jgi:hypothetical protein